MRPVDVKALVRERDGYRCTDCGVPESIHVALTGQRLEVHRMDPGSVYTLAGCVTLCADCHASKPRTAKGAGSTPLQISLSARDRGIVRAAAILAGQPVRSWCADVLLDAAARTLSEYREKNFGKTQGNALVMP